MKQNTLRAAGVATLAIPWALWVTQQTSPEQPGEFYLTQGACGAGLVAVVVWLSRQHPQVAMSLAFCMLRLPFWILALHAGALGANKVGWEWMIFATVTLTALAVSAEALLLLRAYRFWAGAALESAPQSGSYPPP